jgi:hypothetical protein
MGHSNKLAELERLAVDAALIVDDPVERHLVEHLQHLKYQNKRLKTNIDKTVAWPEMKQVDMWKPFDFYNYFCLKFKTRYGREYHATGNIVLVYNNIERFYLENNIEKAAYKDFIDRAFEKYFNKVNSPRVASVCSIDLYQHLMGDTEFHHPSEYRKLDQDILDEAEKFEEKVK